jgi:signal transduction histidine kinase
LRRATHWASAAPRSVAVVIDVSLLCTAVVSVLSRHVVMGFHVIFLLLAIGALTMSFRQFVLRLVIGTTMSSALVVWAVTSLSTPAEELQELPLLTAVLVMIFFVAQARAVAAAERESAHAELDRQSDLALDTLRQQLERSQRLEVLGRTATGLAHDLRNVFVIVRGCADDIVRSQEQEVAMFGSEMITASDRGVQIVDELLSIGKQHDRHDVVIDVGPLMNDLRAMLRRLTRPGVALHVVASPDLPPVGIDRISFTQVLMNLVANANDAISDPIGRITVTAQLVTRAQPGEDLDSRIAITVTDDGDGFDPSTVSQAFDADFTSKGAGHSGLGLTTVRQIAERCGGSISIGSTRHVGTTVNLSLPVVVADASEPTSPRPDDRHNDSDTHGVSAVFDNTTLVFEAVDSAQAARQDRTRPSNAATKHRRSRRTSEESR